LLALSAATVNMLSCRIECPAGQGDGLLRQFDNPTIAVQENGTYGGQGKAAGFLTRAGGFAVSKHPPWKTRNFTDWRGNFLNVCAV
jgi:hypothetical protein